MPRCPFSTIVCMVPLSPDSTGKVCEGNETRDCVEVCSTDTVFNSNGEVLNGNCSVGQLTVTGFHQHLMNGMSLKKSYVDSGFLASNITPSAIYIRSDSQLAAVLPCSL